MKRQSIRVIWAIFVFSMIGPVLLSAQGTQTDYERSFGLREKYIGLTRNLPDQPAWIEQTSRFLYRKTVSGGHTFHVVDAATLEKKNAFDHKHLAKALAQELKRDIDPLKLTLQGLSFTDDEKAIEFDMGDSRYKCDLSTYTLEKTGPSRRFRRRRGGFSMWERGPAPQAASEGTKPSPDKKWEAFIKNYNVYFRSVDTKEEFLLSSDGSEGDYYTFESLSWSPDSKKLCAYRLKYGHHRFIHYVESSPDGQLQPLYHRMEYSKPGDTLDIERPVLFHIDTKEKIDIDNTLFSNPYNMSRLDWRKNSRAFTFEFNQRGHQVYRIIEVDGTTGKSRAVISEECETFFHYSGKKYRYDIQDGAEVIWMSERDGWNHLYLYDGSTGMVKNQITKGKWVVRGVEKVDEKKRQVYFRASGMNMDQDPYFIHYFRIDFDGSNLTPLTTGNFTHQVAFSEDMAFYYDIWSRVDAPQVMELRRTSDQKIIMLVEQTGIQDLVTEGWRAPEVFTAKARDGRTDIWGLICRPTNFDPAKIYPVIEYIYAGPHSSFVPKTFNACHRFQALAELGFIVVQIDGMGTSNRSKAFHDVCWKNLGDAGFPDRILWHKAVAARYNYYDISRVGIYGGSAGGQNSLGGMLNHSDFYKVCVSSCGCHDNRMDKIWWNEQWMGWPLGPEYAASSNVDNAHKLKGKLLLIVGEMDTNVDPASTMQVVNALIKSGKYFDLLVIPGGGHGMGGDYGQRKLMDFFVHHLHGKTPPDWNNVAAKTN